MQRIPRNKLVVYVTILIGLIVAIAIADDVTVKPEEIQVGDLKIYKSGSIVYIEHTASNEDLYIRVNDGGAMTNAIRIDSSEYARVSIYDDLDVDDDLDVGDDVNAADRVYGYLLIANNDVIASDDVVAGDDLIVNDDLLCGKIDSVGGYDPPYVLYDQQSRDEIIEMIQKEVSPDKLGGAALFFNKETKQLETYVASEGKFYDLQGNEVHALSTPVTPTSEYATKYYLDHSTGQVKTRQIQLDRKFVVKEGVELDTKTGRFISEITGQEVSREDALEWYLEAERTYYDLQGNAIRTEPSEENLPQVTEYRFDRQTGQIKVNRNAVHDRYILKDGYRFNETDGQFVDVNGVSVDKEQAVELIRAADRANQ